MKINKSLANFSEGEIVSASFRKGMILTDFLFKCGFSNIVNKEKIDENNLREMGKIDVMSLQKTTEFYINISAQSIAFAEQIHKMISDKVISDALKTLDFSSLESEFF